MKRIATIGGILALSFTALGTLGAGRAAAQDPILTPIIVETAVDTAVPIVVKALKKKPSGLAKFEGYVIHANAAQVTVRSKDNEMAIQSFPLEPDASAKMQIIVEKGGFQYGDKIKIFYDPSTMKATKFKGKPSSPAV
jgi:hypothetical protein